MPSCACFVLGWTCLCGFFPMLWLKGEVSGREQSLASALGVHN